MVIALVLLLSVATWRTTYMLFKESGPLGVFARLRAYLAKNQKRSGGLYDMWSCFQCLSMWVAIVPAALIAGSALTFIGYTLILSGISILIQRVFDKLK